MELKRYTIYAITWNNKTQFTTVFKNNPFGRKQISYIFPMQKSFAPLDSICFIKIEISFQEQNLVMKIGAPFRQLHLRNSKIEFYFSNQARQKNNFFSTVCTMPWQNFTSVTIGLCNFSEGAKLQLILTMDMNWHHGWMKFHLSNPIGFVFCHKNLEIFFRSHGVSVAPWID